MAGALWRIFLGLKNWSGL